jgi:hypothetical protein
MLVTLVDEAVEVVDNKDETRVISKLDTVSDFINGAGAVFGSAFSGVTIEPVEYTGEAKKNKIEDLYYKYAKSAMNLNGIMGMMTGAEGGEDTSAEMQKVESRMSNMQSIQRVLAIKENKRNSIEQKLQREMIKSMTGGDGANLKGMMEMTWQVWKI